MNSLQPILNAFPSLTLRESADVPAVNCPLHRLPIVMKGLKEEFLYDLLVDATAIDWHEASPRFTTVYHLYATQKHVYLRVACDLQDDEDPRVPSMAPLWPAADWHERECYDMFGITFEGHPDLRRILMWDTYPYYPLRKEFPLAGIETDLPAADVADETNAKVIPAPMMGGPFVARPGQHMSKAEPRAADQSWTESREKPTAH